MEQPVKKTDKNTVPAAGPPGEAGEVRTMLERRSFMKRAVAALSALIATAFGWPFASTFFSGIFRLSQVQYVKVPGFASMPVGAPQKAGFPYVEVDAYFTERLTHSVWVVKHSETDATVFSPVCPHLGCVCDWHPSLQQFVCPCHGSIWSVTGTVLDGPSPRPLDTLPCKIDNGELYVEWQQFKVGTQSKVRI
jgi:menaquinol-cytochrome c reductase iron-sulfur subunit